MRTRALIFCIGYGHDLFEDTDFSRAQLIAALKSFGLDFANDVADSIEVLSEPRLGTTDVLSEQRANWRIQKNAYLEALRERGDIAIWITAGADKITQLYSLKKMFDKEGASMWDRFNMPPIEYGSFFERVRIILCEALASTEYRSMYEEYNQAYEALRSTGAFEVPVVHHEVSPLRSLATSP